MAPNMKQPMNLERTAEADFTSYPKEGMKIALLTEPRYAWKQTRVKVFGSGSVRMDLFTDKLAYKPGEGLQVRVKVNNQSARAVTPKYILYRTQSRIFPGGRTTGSFPILERNGKPVQVHRKETTTTVIPIPRGIPPTISIESPIEIQYNLKVCLNTSGSSVTYFTLPILVLPDSIHSAKRQQQLLEALTLEVAVHPNPKQQIPKAGKRSQKARSMDIPPHY
ncbi:arrestin domain-containing protein 2-like [Syngnathoides biaculeatus]|uniref:arrestin domain-containing protein 2-like n=1 Tax=Syngnathoides biaculeatus TaxID=300417 RepID=UPI002ADDA204|nr:arrestin domain-containing protein 2-like [Syngnathoides biaculeatus]XP_061673418.1 arrestin domain-containing protein 2-like [Syngnathoides biaculeatus]